MGTLDIRLSAFQNQPLWKWYTWSRSKPERKTGTLFNIFQFCIIFKPSGRPTVIMKNRKSRPTLEAGRGKDNTLRGPDKWIFISEMRSSGKDAAPTANPFSLPRIQFFSLPRIIIRLEDELRTINLIILSQTVLFSKCFFFVRIFLFSLVDAMTRWRKKKDRGETPRVR